LKHAVQRVNGGTSRPPGKGVAPGPVALVVPKELASLAQSCATDARLRVEVRDYPRFTQTLLRQSAKERMVLVAEAPEVQAALTKDPKLATALDGRGRLILMASDEELGRLELPSLRCVDVIARNPSQELLKFKIHRALTELEFDAEVDTIRTDGLKRGADLDALNEIGMALSTENDLSRLLELIVSKSRQMTWADAGSLYLIEPDPAVPDDQKDYFKNKKMRFQVAQNDSRQVPFRSFVVDINKSSIYGYVALTQEPISLEDVYHIPKDLPYGWGGREFDAAIGYRTMSMLTVPMVNWKGETIGVIQLINRKMGPEIILDDPETCVEYIQPFTSHDLRMALSIASQASIAIQNTQLVDSIRTLFDGFIAASVRAIESRDPTTAGHSQRVATLTVELAEKIDRSKSPKFKDIRFSREEVQEIRYASLLHDFGKIGVREHVLVKAKKLYPHELRAVEDRFELIRTITALKHAVNKARLLESRGHGEESKALIAKQDEQLAKDLANLEELLGFINRCNEPTVLAQGGFEQLHDIAKRAFSRMDGSQVSFLDEKEMVSLSVPRGSLTEQDRKEIESHVTHTYQFLSKIPWTSDLRNVPEIAYAHHEKLDGTGYPNRLDADRIPIQSKMMTISDIFDALTASDRPYKKALPAERALNILQEEAKAGHIDPDLLEIFINADIYKVVLQGQ
jgi:HD-GYP domain-containing protein (c-di-GMP phosphodiesterase class II)